MSYVTFNPNETVYVKNIGYGILINCGQLKSISRKVSNVNVKKQSIYFDPEMFNTHSSSDQSNKSSKSPSQEKLIQKQKIQQQKCQLLQTKPQKQAQHQIKQRQAIKELKQVIGNKSPIKNEDSSTNINMGRPNIVCVKLQGTNNCNNNMKIYAPDNLITKTIDLIIKPMMDATKEQIVISIEITKTIQNLKKLIFTQLNLPMANFFNLRLIAISHIPIDLNNNAFKISQYFIKDCAKLVMIADYAFTFESIKQDDKNPGKFALSNNSYTLNSYKINQKVEQNCKQVMNSPKKQNSPNQNSSAKQSLKSLVQTIQKAVKNEQKQIKKKQQEEIQKQLILQQQPIDIKLEAKISETLKSQSSCTQNSPFITLSCAIKIESSRYYWQFKIDKLPNIQDEYALGLYSHDLSKQSKQTIYWQYNIMTRKKEIIKQFEGNATSQHEQDYGLPVKNADIIGVLVTIKKGIAQITFYKNSNFLMVSLGVCHQISMRANNINYLVPYVTLGGQSQITLDSRANFPLNSFRST